MTIEEIAITDVVESFLARKKNRCQTSEFPALVQELERKLQEERIEFQPLCEIEGSAFISVEFPCGKKIHSLYLNDDQDVKDLLQVKLNGIEVLEGYRAIFSAECGYIEALLSLPAQEDDMVTKEFLLWIIEIIGSNMGGQCKNALFSVAKNSDCEGKIPRITVGIPSKPLMILQNLLRMASYWSPNDFRRILSLRLENFYFSNGEEAQRILLKYSSSIFAQMDSFFRWSPCLVKSDKMEYSAMENVLAYLPEKISFPEETELPEIENFEENESAEQSRRRGK